MNGCSVLRITRKADKAVHFMTENLEPGTEVHQVVDWTRRFDHMQQHSGILQMLSPYYDRILFVSSWMKMHDWIRGCI